MSEFGQTDHEVYKKRGRMNAQIGLVLGALVLLIMLGTYAKFTDRSKEAQVNVAPVNQEQGE